MIRDGWKWGAVVLLVAVVVALLLAGWTWDEVVY